MTRSTEGESSAALDDALTTFCYHLCGNDCKSGTDALVLRASAMLMVAVDFLQATWGDDLLLDYMAIELFEPIATGRKRSKVNWDKVNDANKRIH